MIKTLLVCNRCKKEKELDFDQVALSRETTIGEAGFYSMGGRDVHMCEDCLQSLNQLKKEMDERVEKFMRGLEDGR